MMKPCTRMHAANGCMYMQHMQHGHAQRKENYLARLRAVHPPCRSGQSLCDSSALARFGRLAASAVRLAQKAHLSRADCYSACTYNMLPSSTCTAPLVTNNGQQRPPAVHCGALCRHVEDLLVCQVFARSAIAHALLAAGSHHLSPDLGQPICVGTSQTLTLFLLAPLWDHLHPLPSWAACCGVLCGAPRSCPSARQQIR